MQSRWPGRFVYFIGIVLYFCIGQGDFFYFIDQGIVMYFCIGQEAFLNFIDKGSIVFFIGQVPL